jgi:hypothetical protein
MKKSNRLILTAVAILLASVAIVLTSSASDKKKKTVSPTCCKKIETKCGPNNKKTGSGELIMDNMSRQFISIFSATY